MSAARFLVAAGLVGILMFGASVSSATERGKVTNLPIPRFVSMKASEGNVRRGPSLNHRIDWVYKRRDIPLVITDEFGNWRRVEDRDGAGGWMHHTLLSGVRTVIIEHDMVAMRLRPDQEAPVNARAEAGVIAELDACIMDWCRVEAGKHKGWVMKTSLWGTTPEEIRE